VSGPVLRGPGPLVERIGSGFKGAIDEVRIWGRALRAEEIAEHVATVLDGDEADLIAYYRFDDGTSGTNASGTGVSGSNTWQTGHVEDFVTRYERDWRNEWRHGGTLRGGATFADLSPTNSPVKIEDDEDGDGLPEVQRSGHGP
jgi:hypothetical protein